MAQREQPHIYTIPPTRSFLDALARAVLTRALPELRASDDVGDDLGDDQGAGSSAPAHEIDFSPQAQLALTKVTLFLPTRRACRAMREAFLRVSGGQAMLLPQIKPIGDVDEDEAILADAALGGLGGEGSMGAHHDLLSLPPAVSDLHRRLWLTQLIIKWGEMLKQATGQDENSANPHEDDGLSADGTAPLALRLSGHSPAQASALAAELIRFMDEVETEQADFAKLVDLVPEGFSEHWQITLDFLKIITEFWPQYLEEIGEITAMARRNKMLEMEAERLQRVAQKWEPVLGGETRGSDDVAQKWEPVLGRETRGSDDTGQKWEPVLGGETRGSDDVAQKWEPVLGRETRSPDDTGQRSGDPIIAAGITGSIPASANLLRVIAHLPRGAVILPGLDLALDEESWDMLTPKEEEQDGAADSFSMPPFAAPPLSPPSYLEQEDLFEKEGFPGHPQYGMKIVLDRLGASRADVKYVPGTEPGAGDEIRMKLISEALRPSERTDLWQAFTGSEANRAALDKALDARLDDHNNAANADVSSGGVMTLMSAPTAQDEAEAIALILRAAAEDPNQSAALISPDRILARRVSTRLQKWGLAVDDSAGRPLAKTVPGVFMDLVAQAIDKQFKPADLIALLKHPLTRLGFKAGEIRAAARILELGALRQILRGGGLDNIAQALQETADAAAKGDLRHIALRRVQPREWERAIDLIERLRAAYAPLLALYQANKPTSLQAYVEAHIAVGEALAKDEAGAKDETGDEAGESGALWAGDAGETMSLHLAGMMDKKLPSPHFAPSHYGEFYRSLIAGQAMRSRAPVHPRLFIWGPLEARLQQVHTIILGGLNEGTWPQTATSDPWLSRPMRAKLGLPAPEQKIGFAAHDFAQLLGAQKIYLTRAAKVDGVPSVPSRWLQRILALLEGMGLRHKLEGDKHTPWMSWAQQRNEAAKRHLISAPEPRPPVSARPRQLSVTQIEDWIANPYSIYASKILRLDPLDKLGGDPDAALRGDIIHRVLHRFSEKFPQDVPKDAHAALIALAEDELSKYHALPRVMAFWRPRFLRFAAWFVETEPARRAGLDKIYTEISGRMDIATLGENFTLTARADRIDKHQDGRAVIYDYKSGLYPKDSEVKSARAPQLPLEAAILSAGGFEIIGRTQAAALHYISATGGVPAGEDHKVKHDDPEQLAEQILEGLKRLINEYDQEQTAYKALRRPNFEQRYRYDDYAHLARVLEWASQEEEAG